MGFDENMSFKEAESHLKEHLSAIQEVQEADKAKTAAAQSLLKGGKAEKSWADLEENCALAAERKRVTREPARKAWEVLLKMGKASKTDS